MKSRGTRHKCDFLCLHLRITNNSQYVNPEFFLEFHGQGLHGGLRKSEDILIPVVLIFFPSERMSHSRLNAIRIAPVPMVVKSPDDKIVLGNERQFCGENRILVLLFQHIELIQMIVKSRFVRNDKILAGSRRAFEYLHRGHHGYGNAGDWCIRVACLESIHSLRLPRHTHVDLYTADDFPRSQLAVLPGS